MDCRLPSFQVRSPRNIQGASQQRVSNGSEDESDRTLVHPDTDDEECRADVGGEGRCAGEAGDGGGGCPEMRDR